MKPPSREGSNQPTVSPVGTSATGAGGGPPCAGRSCGACPGSRRPRPRLRRPRRPFCPAASRGCPPPGPRTYPPSGCPRSATGGGGDDVSAAAELTPLLSGLEAASGAGGGSGAGSRGACSSGVCSRSACCRGACCRGARSRGARSTTASAMGAESDGGPPASGEGPSRYGFSSPLSSVAGRTGGRVPRPRRGGRRLSVMQQLSCQGEVLAKHARRARVLLVRWYDRVSVERLATGGCRAASVPFGSRDVTDWCDATRCFASYVCRRGYLTRCQTMNLQGRGASLAL